ncbi:16S rRNA (cytidine(1402)-2'-O)-methyltransferase [Tunturibacter empetritectus]|uniref:Ribosomal RNA small subunit methyltransferase I n=1 Tax=Tunturiibacter empetritectus TaxID=3069691 RepID=A0A7W8IMZ6_9BACT|nr:16S rRNA (cytidine(1402)-2'-O)-methyltransferase [Edaphobacter lichenicola]MBB5319148.1 16S rRNA (cytidine1402-2'-O)-methyltransferase [Edaphobacter lichenicola]
MLAHHDKGDRPLAPGLYLVATPIGNLEDITLRALRVLRQADRIACEDTRQTQKLLNHFEIHTPTVSYHMHNEGSRTEELIAELKTGARIAVVSDAGTPGIADPGGQIVAAALAAGVDVFPIPGANAAISGLIASGLSTERFTFHSFLPAKAGQRKTALEDLVRGEVTHVFYEAPHRILDTLADIDAVFGPEQYIVIARELTKLHEEFLRGTVADLRSQLATRASVRGEIVLMLAPTSIESTSEDKKDKKTTLAAEISAMMKSEGISEMDALKRVARERGIGKSEAYRELQREQNRRR